MQNRKMQLDLVYQFKFRGTYAMYVGVEIPAFKRSLSTYFTQL